METTFRLPVIRQLIYRDLFLGRKTALILTGVLTGVLILNGLIAHMDHSSSHTDFHMTWYGLFFLLLGFFHTGSAFREFAQPATRQEYLLLPASSLEKWTSRWFRTLPLYLIVFTMIYWLASWVMNLAVLIAFKEILIPFNPLNTNYLVYWKIFIVVHAILMIGAVHFNRVAAFRTTLVIMAFLTVLGILGTMTTWLFFHDWANQGVFVEPRIRFDLSQHADLLLGPVGKVILWCLLIPFFWWVSILKLNEKEV